MALHDTFDFDEAAYRAKCAARPTPKLQQEEIRKLRQHFAASASIALGLSHAVQTGGLTVGVSALALRRYWVARQKLGLIRAELAARGVALHALTKRDAGIPLGASLVGVGLGAGVGHLVGGVAVVDVDGGSVGAGASASASASAVHVPMPGHHGASAALGLVQGDPEGAAHGFVQGLSDQASAVGHAVHEAVLSHTSATGAGGLAAAGHLDLGGSAAAAAAAAAAAGDAAQQQAALSGHEIGYAVGLAAAKKMEELVGETVGETVFAFAMEKLLDPEIRLELRRKEKCSRLQGPLGQYCQRCGTSIRHGVFAHCCQGTDDFDLCKACRDAGSSCACEDKTMRTLQKCVAGDVLESESGDAARRLAAMDEIRCRACARTVSQGRYYYCPECDKQSGGADICQECYFNGQTCLVAHKHRLVVYLRANFDINTPDMAVADSSQSSSCHGCSRKTVQGPVFVCPSHNLRVCDRCYEMDRACGDATHVLTRYVVYSGEKHIKKPLADDKKNTCRFCTQPLHSTIFYCCTQCSKGCYDLCLKCYVKGAGCEDRTHALQKCIPSTAAAKQHGRAHLNLHEILLSADNREKVKGYLQDQKARINMMRQDK